jgi:SM-20-related protein
MTNPYETPIVVFEEFLSAGELTALHRFITENEASFVGSQVLGQDGAGVEEPRFRRSRQLFNVGEYYDLLGRRIIHFISRILYGLQFNPFPIKALEVQLTASNHGDFFCAHTDSDSGLLRTRMMTFVYFCHHEPRAFQGGELRIYGRDPISGVDLSQLCHVIKPAQNSIVFFPSDRLHEITPIVCPTGAFVHSRFTLNGWLHR